MAIGLGKVAVGKDHGLSFAAVINRSQSIVGEGIGLYSSHVEGMDRDCSSVVEMGLDCSCAGEKYFGCSCVGGKLLGCSCVEEKDHD